MSATSVSVVIPLAGRSASPARAEVVAYLETTGFTFEVLEAEAEEPAGALRRGVSDAKGDVVVVVDPASRTRHGPLAMPWR